jgi:GT2 family glycosyltransferase
MTNQFSISEASEKPLGTQLQAEIPEVSVVVIGRNEGERLVRCLKSIRQVRGVTVNEIVYVDSGSTDQSCEFAASMDCIVVELDPSRPFSAARARNDGFAALIQHHPEAAFIQFLDGDTELLPGWLDRGLATLASQQDVGMVCGHFNELHPTATIYNQLCDLEWQQPPGETLSAGGLFLIRSDIFRTTGGFRADVIAGEDYEFCLRVRKAGSKILLLDEVMARHDVAMVRFSQWWRRSIRTGHAFAHVAALHGRGEYRYFVAHCRRIWAWALILPVIAIALAPVSRGISILTLVCAYALQFARTYIKGRQRRWSGRQAFIYSFFTMLFKFPALIGMFQYYWRQWRGRGMTIIEYKGIP